MEIQPIDRTDLGAGTAKTVRDANFSSHWLRDVAGKEVEYVGCNFSAAIIERGYFFHAKFKNCTFIGVRFIDCNFRQATFEQCKFDYADFNRCVLPAPQILANLPSFANVRWELLHNLRANERTMGDTRHEAEIVQKEIDAEIDHWRSIRTRPSGYYEKYNNLRDYSSAWYHTVRLVFERYVWGHGESLLRLSVATVLALVLLSVFHCISNIETLGQRSVSFFTNSFTQSIYFIFQLFVDLPSINVVAVTAGPVLSTLAVILRYVAIGLAIPVLYKHISKR